MAFAAYPLDHSNSFRMTVQPASYSQLLPLTVLISYHNNQSFLDKLLESIMLSDIKGWIYEIVVIDSGSDSPPQLPKDSLCTIQSIYNPVGSLTSSLNIGLRYAKTEWICILDCDTEVIDKQFWTIVAKIAQENVSVGIPASLSSNYTAAECFDFIDTVLLGYLFSKRLVSPLLKAYYQKKSELLQSSLPFKVPYFWNQCIFLNASIKDRFIYNESLYVWACDFELSSQLARHREQVVCFPEYRIIHHGEGSGSHNSLSRIRGVLEGEYTYINLIYGHCAFIIHLMAIMARLVRLSFRMIFQRNSIKVDIEKLILKTHLSLFRDQFLRRPNEFKL